MKWQTFLHARGNTLSLYFTGMLVFHTAGVFVHVCQRYACQSNKEVYAGEFCSLNERRGINLRGRT